ncbi:MAG: UTP--glucose-1-phosphate uridylyltransferase [Promicromonosporaceae bacterium]|nr:UTP--glucose-1-phosphate uridylyltransferase [Promicromonosporaceae bacterium]
MTDSGLRKAQYKMLAAGQPRAAVDAFTRFYGLLTSGEATVIRENDIEPLGELPKVDLTRSPSPADIVALGQTAIVKLNGGLGTSMGMKKAKSLLPVKWGPLPGVGEEIEVMLTFLDIIAGQVLSARAATGAELPVIFLNSFRTREDTHTALAKFPELAVDGLPEDIVQNKEPKLSAVDLTPISWPANPELEWCPPGHGDLYPAMAAAGLVNQLLTAGYRYLFVSNADNLGATPDPRVAGWFAASGAPYAAEMCLKTPADVKGGQLVIRKSDGQLIQRETAQTHPDDMAISLDPTRHRYFHTNNLWFDLEALNTELERTGGVLDLPLLRNEKTVDPSDPTSPKVIQIESAMGAAIRVFPGAAAVEVPRERFLPVKTTNDLTLLRSDVYELTPGYYVRAVTEPPVVELDGHYQTIADFDARFANGVPSLKNATLLRVFGDVHFGKHTVMTGDTVITATSTSAQVPDNTRLSGAVVI